ncbi:hypothetical protein [Oceanobacillus iheyensis HTE831]|uniref:PD-(D/E)XK motif protein n=1 Tax=Oceanobacillus iheyensis (strain DSM 14371 / CIP 107618 / JCM 11309 / KCTC 3954 / HTE831) TaxID=221109 RepID=Q8ETT0_OCEIH|nr:PD-(D/E)XK motif protein [Oceanobacillus iheyensis]BAC12132.1 hypothetical protein [Oceanobacillus iheyensis HTE831]
MTNNENPWEGMGYSSQRRVESSMRHNIYWITDLHGNYGLYFLVGKVPFGSDNSIKLKGITIIKRPKGKLIELFLILNNKEDWQVFHVLCNDLITVAKEFDSEERLISSIEIRLIRWQQLLKQDRSKMLTLEEQMGLFSELLCLKDVVGPIVGINQAIRSWVGPDFDKQDFLFDNSVVEVKSYKTSKGEIINISSKEQLYTLKNSLYLITYAISLSQNGSSVKDVVNHIRGLIKNEEDNDIINIFEYKLIDYGYIPEIIKEPLRKFKVDKQRYYLVSDNFPRIVPKDIRNEITSVKYSIDLSSCHEFEIDSLKKEEI